MSRLPASLLLVVLFGSVPANSQPVSLVDSSGHGISLQGPAKRVISLAPNLTELMFAINAGDSLIAVSDYSDYPVAAKTLPRIGSAVSMDVERIVDMKPDLVLTWKTGTPVATQEYLRKLKLPVFEMEFGNVDEIAREIRVLGKLTGQERVATGVSNRFRAGLDRLRNTFSHRKKVSVFYQVWNQPLMTVSNKHFIGDLIRLCGGRNTFGNLPTLVSTVDIESIVGRAPEVIIAAGNETRQASWLKQWSRWSSIPAVKNNHIYFISPDLLSRPGTRILQGAEILCRDLETVRQAS